MRASGWNPLRKRIRSRPENCCCNFVAFFLLIYASVFRLQNLGFVYGNIAFPLAERLFLLSRIASKSVKFLRATQTKR